MSTGTNNLLARLVGLGGASFWHRFRDAKTSRSVDVARTITEQRSRYNPLRNFTPDKLVRAIDNWRIGTLGELARILEELEQRDDMIIACANKMKASVARCKHSVQIVEGQEDNPEAQKHKKTLEDFWASIKATSAFARNERGGFRLLVKQMMDAQHAKFAVHEIIWEPHRDGSLSARFQFVPLWMFENHTGELRFLDYYGAYDGKPMAPGEWLVTVGEGVGIAAAVAAMSKRLAMNDWLLFSEKCGTPGLHAKTEAPEGSESWEKLVEALRNFGRDWSILTDTTTDINTVSLTQSGQTPYPEFVRAMNRAISVLYRGADLSTLSGEGGDRTGASLQGEESDILEQDACEMLSETLQEQVDKFVIEYTYGHGVKPLAYIQIEPNAKQDAKLDMDIDNHLMDSGINLSKNDMLRRYGRTEYKPEDTTDAPLKRTPPPQGGGQPPKGEENASPFGLRALANEADDGGAKIQAWQGLKADLGEALAACEAAIKSKDKDGFIAALRRLPKSTDGQRLSAALAQRMKVVLRLANAADDFDEGEHPRGPDGRFIKGEGVGRDAETYAYQREGRTFKLDRRGNHVYEDDPTKGKFSFSRMRAKLRKDKPTPNLDRYRAIPDSGKRLFSQMDEGDYYRRGNRIGDGKNGTAMYEWTIGGRPVPAAQAPQLEAAFKEAGCVVFDPTAKTALVRRDFATGRGQLYAYTAKDGRVQVRQDRQTEAEAQDAKFHSVDSIVERYDKLFGHIEKDAKAGSAEANVAYFLTRSKCRIGGAAKNDNLGALDLTSDNIRVDGDTVTLDFDAKNAHWKQTIRDKALAEWMGGRLAATPKGQPVLGSLTTPARVNQYLTRIGQREGVVPDGKGKGFTAHNIRHLGATRLASELVDKITIDPDKDRDGYLSELAKVVVRCGHHICDTPEVARARYISPTTLFKNAPALLEEYRRAYANEDGDNALDDDKKQKICYNTGMTDNNDKPSTIIFDDGDGVITEVTPKSDAFYTDGAFGEDDDTDEDDWGLPDEICDEVPALAELRQRVNALAAQEREQSKPTDK